MLGVIAVIAAIKSFRNSSRLVSGILALMWAWVGVAYFMLHFSAINLPATVFGALFVLQGLLFAGFGAAGSRLQFQAAPNARGIIGGLVILYAMVIYPLLGFVFGHVYPQSPVFGVAPCPTLIFTFGLLLWTSVRFPWYLLIVPILWALIGISAAVNLGVREDFGLPLSWLITFILLIARGRAATENAEVNSPSPV